MSLQNEYSSEAPDNLFAGHFTTSPEPTGGKLPSAAAGILKRGTALKRTANADEFTPVLATDTAVHAILAADVEVGDTKIAVYQKGAFNRYAVIFPATKTFADFQAGSADYTIYFPDVVRA